VGADRGAIGRIALTPQRRVRRFGFGGAWLTGPGTYGPPPDLDAARRAVRLAAAAGIQLFDTADCYGPHVSETLIAEALHPYPEDVIVSTKGGRLALGDNRWRTDGRPEHLRRACEGSLRRLRLDAIDLYQLNAVDPDVPIEESLGALLELRDAGLIRAVGVCNVTVEALERACAVAPIASVQNRYDIHTRDADPVLELCVRSEIAFLPWFPPPNGMRAARGSPLERIATARGATPAQVAIAWLVRRAPVTIPLPGTSDPDRLAEDLGALELRLDDEEVSALTAMAG
jgi:aryl-alcohol dehydrogenase-like predicted oxidoreductase